MGNKKGSKVRRYMKSLLRLLSKPKDMYVHAITACSTHFPYADAPMGFPAPNFTTCTFPRSFSVASSSAPAPAPSRSSTTSDDDDDLKHLLRSSSVRSSRRDLLLEHHARKQPARLLPRSCSIGRIDEDKPCEFRYDDQCDFSDVTPQVCPRSYAVHGRRRRRASTGVF